MRNVLILLLVVITSSMCGVKEENSTLFVLKDNTATGIEFSNDLTDTDDFNIYKYRNYYNGGGVAIGDINNDGYPDIYLVSNQGENKLYLNKGNWQFEDITTTARVGGQKAWSTGVTMVDINGDGWLDIYVCNSGDVKGDNKENEMFINNGDMTFTESAAEYGLNDPGFSTHAAFFDFDKDGDLDVYVLNNSFQSIGSFNLRKNERPVRDSLGGDKLYKNVDGKFVDVSEDAGIYGSVIGFGLGISIGDVNNDGWEDIYISNDFFERDYLYINQQDGTFKEDLINQMQSISAASMGADIADINNDGYNDIFVTDMLPSDYERLKSVTTFEDWDRYIYGVNNGYYYQFIRNTLQLNNANNTFSEISRLAGVEASDWSWGALFFDMDNDGHKDLFIANGIYRDLTDQDYLQYVSSESVMASIIKDDGVNFKELIDIIPSRPVPNHAFKNAGNLLFSKYVESGLLIPGFSNGSAYADLDNDGDLDLVVNNVNMPCFVFENKATDMLSHNYIKIELKGEGKNTYGVGARIEVTGDDGVTQFYDNQPARGFQSSMDNRVNIGLGNANKANVKVVWPSMKVTEIKEVEVNTKLTLFEKDAISVGRSSDEIKLAFTDVSHLLPYEHKENFYIDFNRERLNYHMMSTRGPVVARGDLNGNGLVDLIIPGPKGMATQIFFKNADGSYAQRPVSPEFEKIKEAEHIKCYLFDADNDGDLDLYLVSGGVEISEYSEYLYDHLFLNDGKGGFISSGQLLPKADSKISTGVVVSSDIDRDGYLDLFVGERVKIGQYGALCSGFILMNDGKGNFTDETDLRCSELNNIGMITDAAFADLNGDGNKELIVVGEFMGVHIFQNKGGRLEQIQMSDDLKGWWNVMHFVDLDNDGDLDIVLGNHGINSRFKADKDHPLKMYFHDFDDNGSPEGIWSNVHENGNAYPYALRHNLMARLPSLKKKFPNFESFKNATMEDIFTQELLDQAILHTANELKSIVLINEGNFSFTKKELPASAQFSPIYAIASEDLNQDGYPDLLLGGNLYGVQPEAGRYDASYGHILINDGKGNFTDKSLEYGFSIKGEIRDIYIDENKVFVFRNNDSVLGLQLKK